MTLINCHQEATIVTVEMSASGLADVSLVWLGWGRVAVEVERLLKGRFPNFSVHKRSGKNPPMPAVLYERPARRRP